MSDKSGQSPNSKPQGVKRNDPDPRPVDGALPRVAIDGKDPNKHYVWVSNVNDPTMNPGSYLAQGYKFSQYDGPDSTQPVLGYNPDLKQGDRMQAFGATLMECTLEHKEKLDAVGQKWADRVVETIQRRDIADETEPLTKAQRAAMRGIVTKRYGGDDRAAWEF